jgi:hypothetical protein
VAGPFVWKGSCYLCCSRRRPRRTHATPLTSRAPPPPNNGLACTNASYSRSYFLRSRRTETLSVSLVPANGRPQCGTIYPTNDSCTAGSRLTESHGLEGQNIPAGTMLGSNKPRRHDQSVRLGRHRKLDDSGTARVTVASLGFAHLAPRPLRHSRSIGPCGRAELTLLAKISPQDSGSANRSQAPRLGKLFDRSPRRQVVFDVVTAVDCGREYDGRGPRNGVAGAPSKSCLQ